MPVSLAPVSRPSLTVIGNFDGVHRGHQAVLTRAVGEAERRGLQPMVVTFDPHPALVLGRTPPTVLTPLARKVTLLGQLFAGLSVVVQRFDHRLAGLSPEAFCETVLRDELRSAEVVVGKNFRFGKGRAGDFAVLERLGERLGFAAVSAEIAGDARGPWSSTRVRAAIVRGDWADVQHVLGRPHALTGEVTTGDRRGRTIGFPTANLAGVAEAMPPNGVYAVLVDRIVDGTARALAGGVANVGLRPTVGASPRPTVEVHLLGYDGDLYGATLRLHIVSFLREERRFPGLSELKEQIARDASDGKRLLDPYRADERAGGAWY